MKTWNTLLGPTIIIGMIMHGATLWAASVIKITPASENGSESREADQKILVELFLSPEHRKDLNEIKKAFEAVSITRLRAQFFRAGHPPENIAIGSGIPASVARLAIRIAITYNRGIKYLLPEYRYFPSHIAIGTSAFDEASQIPIVTPNLLVALPHTPLYERLQKANRLNSCEGRDSNIGTQKRGCPDGVLDRYLYG